MKTAHLRSLLAACVALVASGCTTIQKLPPITAQEIDYKRTDPLGGTTISAKNVQKSSDGTITAEEVTWDTKYPQVSIHLSVKGYVQTP